MLKYAFPLKRFPSIYRPDLHQVRYVNSFMPNFTVFVFALYFLVTIIVNFVCVLYGLAEKQLS